MSAGILHMARASNTDNDPLRKSSTTAVGTAGVSVKGTPGRIYEVCAVSADATIGAWLQIFDKATAAVNNDVPIYRQWIPGTTDAVGDATIRPAFPWGLYCSLGISIAFSSTPALLTLVGASNFSYTAIYK